MTIYTLINPFLVAKPVFSFLILVLCLTSIGIPLQSHAQQPFICTGDFYLSLSTSQGNSTFYQLAFDPLSNIADFNQLSIGNSTAIVNGIGYRSTDNLIYGVHPNNRSLYQIDATGIATFLTVLNNISNENRYFSGDMTPDGKFLVLIGTREGTPGGNSWDTDLVTINIESGNYEATSIPLKSTSSNLQNTPASRCADIAFDPNTGVLYGYDGLQHRLITIDMETGEYLDNAFPASNLYPAVLGAIFFDAFSNLYAYGRPANGNIQNTFFKVDKGSGVIESITTGPNASGNDGCSCPYTIKMNKEVSQSQTLPCSEVIYTFEIVNNSGSEQNEVNFTDVMPTDFLITEILSNPFGGNIIQGLGANNLEISGMTLPVGTFDLQVSVEIGEEALGIYNNQAMLWNLPSSLGEMTLSDDPRTSVLEDSTQLEVIPLDIQFLESAMILCEGDTILLDATFSGVTYEWDDGSDEPTLLVTAAGTYSVTATSNCDESIESILISEVNLGLDLGADLEIELGESISIDPVLFNGVEPSYEWSSINGQNPALCVDCSSQELLPLFNDVYTLFLTLPSGCTVSDELKLTINKNRDVYIPNAFSPNFDGRNDYFYPFSFRQEKLKLLRIYNRWGALVYETAGTQTNDYSVGWNGLFNGKAVNPDVYLYWIEVEFLDGHIEVFQGDISVVK